MRRLTQNNDSSALLIVNERPKFTQCPFQGPFRDDIFLRLRIAIDKNGIYVVSKGVSLE